MLQLIYVSIFLVLSSQRDYTFLPLPPSPPLSFTFFSSPCRISARPDDTSAFKRIFQCVFPLLFLSARSSRSGTRRIQTRAAPPANYHRTEGKKKEHTQNQISPRHLIHTSFACSHSTQASPTNVGPRITVEYKQT